MVRRYLAIASVIGLLAATPAVRRVEQHLDSGPWHASVTKTLLGSNDGTTFYQWAIHVRHGRTSYDSPKNGGPLDTVTKAHGAQMWFPHQSVHTLATARLMNGTDEQLVVLSHQSGADCGSADLTVFGYDAAKRRIVPAVTVKNGCDLRVQVVHGANGRDSLELSGPYYNATAPMCCPTKPKASAKLVYVNGSWMEQPNYYHFFSNAFPHR